MVIVDTKTPHTDAATLQGYQLQSTFVVDTKTFDSTTTSSF